MGDRMAKRSVLQAFLNSVADAGRELLYGGAVPILKREQRLSIQDLCHQLLSQKGEAMGTALAREVMEAYSRLDDEERNRFFAFLQDEFEPDPDQLKIAIEDYLEDPTPTNRLALERGAEAPRQKLIRAMNMAPKGTRDLVAMRDDLLAELKQDDSLKVVDADFAHLFSSWFNRGFLKIRAINWNSPAAVLEKLIAYEAVHEIRGWDDLRRRLEADRRCYAFFHPALPDEPLIFVEVALTRGLATSIQDLLDCPVSPGAEQDSDTAIFYSISNCQTGLRGISFGNFLIKQVVAELQAELPHLKAFSTLSPIPGFGRWLSRQRDEDDRGSLDFLDEADWFRDPETADHYRVLLLTLCARYLALEKRREQPLDPVARFHLGNGACLERINFLGDVSEKGIEESAGLMVNYVYDLTRIESNHEAFANRGVVTTSKEVRSLLAG